MGILHRAGRFFGRDLRPSAEVAAIERELRQQIKEGSRGSRKALRALTDAEQRLLRAAARVEALENRNAQLKAKLDASVSERRRLRRKMLERTPLPGLLRQRKPTFPPPARRAEGEARETAFRSSCPAYTAALDAPWPPDGVSAIERDGLRLWIPHDERLPERVERAAQQDIPFSAVLQSREVAIGGVMLDIGCNIGRTSFPRVLLGDALAVYGAEADADNYACLVHGAIDNGLRGFVLPDHLAISAVDGTATLRRSRFVGGHRLLAGGHADSVETLEVRTRRVDTWIAEHGVAPADISFVKVDVQGWEPGVVAGAPGLLAQRTAAWQLEVDPHLLRLAGSSVQDLIAAVTPHFTHFVDLRDDAPGARHRPVSELAEALAYLPADSSDGTDVLFYAVPA